MEDFFQIEGLSDEEREVGMEADNVPPAERKLDSDIELDFDNDGPPDLLSDSDSDRERERLGHIAGKRPVDLAGTSESELDMEDRDSGEQKLCSGSSTDLQMVLADCGKESASASVSASASALVAVAAASQAASSQAASASTSAKAACARRASFRKSASGKSSDEWERRASTAKARGGKAQLQKKKMEKEFADGISTAYQDTHLRRKGYVAEDLVPLSMRTPRSKARTGLKLTTRDLQGRKKGNQTEREVSFRELRDIGTSTHNDSAIALKHNLRPGYIGRSSHCRLQSVIISDYRILIA